MCVTNNLIAAPRHAPTMPIGPANRSVNLAAKIRIDHPEGACEPISPPGKRPPSNTKRLGHPLSQVALHPLPAQNDSQRPEHAHDARNHCDVTPSCDLLESHTMW